MFRQTNKLCLFSSPNFLLLLSPVRYYHYCSLPQTIEHNPEQSAQQRCQHIYVHSTDVSWEKKKNKSATSYQKPVTHRLCEWTGDELAKNRSHNFYIFILKISCWHQIFRWLKGGVEMNLTKERLPIWCPWVLLTSEDTSVCVFFFFSLKITEFYKNPPVCQPVVRVHIRWQTPEAAQTTQWNRHFHKQHFTGDAVSVSVPAVINLKRTTTPPDVPLNE